jgi:hypothetical protein
MLVSLLAVEGSRAGLYQVRPAGSEKTEFIPFIGLPAIRRKPLGEFTSFIDS